MITDDPVRDALDKMSRDDAAEAERPHCSVCGEPLWEDTAVEYNGRLYCPECEDEAWRAIREEFVTRLY
jgi:uncharacterized Zn finger protein (UPF0148 family)